MLTKPRPLLLIDFGGALLTSLVTGLILPLGLLQTGLPALVLYTLALVAACFAGFDLLTYLFVPAKTWPLATIGILNLIYCVLVATICTIYSVELTWLGLSYFAIESVIVVPLACWELVVASRTADAK